MICGSVAFGVIDGGYLKVSPVGFVMVWELAEPLRVMVPAPSVNVAVPETVQLPLIAIEAPLENFLPLTRPSLYDGVLSV